MNLTCRPACCLALQENQTKPEGCIHFFPVIFDGKQLYDVMVERCGPSCTSGPKGAAEEEDEE